jgi:transcriptional regulatory protein RtcR
MGAKQQVVFGLIGSQLDRGHDVARWESWRPSVSICQHEELLVHRFELLHQAREVRLAETVAGDIRSVSPETEVRLHEIDLVDAWDFEEVFGRLHGFARDYPFHTDCEDYLVHISTGTHVEQICLFLLTESRHLPGRLLQSSPPKRNQPVCGRYRIIDLDLSRYDALAARFALEQQEGLSFLKSGIATRNAAFNALIERIERVAVHSRRGELRDAPRRSGNVLPFRSREGGVHRRHNGPARTLAQRRRRTFVPRRDRRAGA